MNQAALQAQTDQAIAQVAANRRNPPDAAAQVTLPVARQLADALADEFSSDAAVAGRALVSAAAKITGLLKEFEASGVPPMQRARVMVNVLAFTGEQLHREATQ